MKHINAALFIVNEGCPHRCSFCNQRSVSGFSKKTSAPDVEKAAQIAVKTLSREETENGEIAFFGGSFTMIEREYMLSLLEAAYKYVEKGIFKGIRISTRPDGIDDERCRILKDYGVTSVELGVQSLDDEVLRLNDRGCGADDVARACETLKKYGFELGLQMMTGLYGSGDSDCVKTAEGIIALSPATVRIYPTVVLKGTKLHRLVLEGKFKPKGVPETARLCAKLILMFEEAGIRVIRVGLHSGGGVEEAFAGGAYHPALRELCEGEIYYDRALGKLRKLGAGEYELFVAPREISKAIGQKKRNLARLAEEGFLCGVKGREGLKKYEVEIVKGRVRR